MLTVAHVALAKHTLKKKPVLKVVKKPAAQRKQSALKTKLNVQKKSAMSLQKRPVLRGAQSHAARRSLQQLQPPALQSLRLL